MSSQQGSMEFEHDRFNFKDKRAIVEPEGWMSS
jgi:hypothetical protein